jgi:class 3 adenylate cyclase/tetratricopeptide (TPR) repeat protein
MVDSNPQIERIKTALSELRDNKAHFTNSSYAQIVLALMERLRKLQTVRTKEPNTPATDEIRLVTVVFVDIVDSTILAQSMDNSDWKNAINDAHTRIADVVSKHDGQVGQYLGDGVLCFFGAQHSRSDDALRAVTCALAIQQDLETLGNHFFLTHGKEFSARIAITTGRLVVGMIGNASKQELLALGPATNLASRLQNLAPSGGIVVDNATYGRVRGAFIVEHQAPVQLKGFEKPTPYYLVRGQQMPTSTPLATTKLFGIELPFVDRQEALDTIQHAWSEAKSKQAGYSLTVHGMLGMGKSRLLYETMHNYVPDEACRVLMVARYERRSTSYNLLRDMLLRACNLTDDTPPETVRQAIWRYVTEQWQDDNAEIAATVMAFMAGFGGDQSPHVQPLLRGGQDGAQRGFAWVLRFLRGMANDLPLLLLIDNVQWADNDSQALLRYLHENLADVPSLVLMTLRDDVDDDATTTRTMPAIPISKRHQTLHLEPLQARGTKNLVDGVRQHVRGAPAGLVQIIQERAEGNPLFIVEFLGMLFDNGVFVPDEKADEAYAWRWDRMRYEETASHLPDGLIGVLQARMDDLSHDARQVLQVSAVVGQSFWAGAVTEIVGFDVETILQNLVERDIIYRNSDSGLENEEQYTFRHALYRHVAYEMLPRVTREAYHQEIARWLVIRITGKTDYFGLLAEHFSQGGQYEAALFTYLEAIQNRFSRGMLNEALTMIDIGLSLGGRVPREVALSIISQLWTVRASIFNELLRYDEAIAASHAALNMLGEMQNQELLHVRVEAARMLGIAHRSQGHYSEAIGALSRAFEIMDEENPVQRASLLRSFGSLSMYMGLLDEALAYQKRSYEAAQISQDQTSITGATMQLGLIALEQGRLADALMHFENVLRINHERGYTHFQVGDLRNIGQVYNALMDYERAFAVYEEARELQRQLGTPDNLLDALHGVCLMRLGDVRLGMEQVLYAAQQGHVDVYHSHLLQLAHIEALYLHGNYEDCIQQANRFVSETTSLSPILRGRAFYHIGCSRMALDDAHAYNDLETALALEVEYAGRDVWRQHWALAQANTNTDDAQATRHQERAAHLLRQWADSLGTYPDLQYAFLHRPDVMHVLDVVY